MTTLNRYQRSDITGYGFEIEHAGRRMHSIAWPHLPAERMMADEMERKGVVCEAIDAPEPAGSDEEDEDTDNTVESEESEVDEKPVSEAESIRQYLTANPNADNKTVVAALAELKIEVSSSQVTTQRKKLQG